MRRNDKKATILLYTRPLVILDELTDEQAGRLFKAIRFYVEDEEGMEEKLHEVLKDPFVRLAFAAVRADIDQNAERYEKIVEKRRIAGRKHKGNQYTNGTNVPQTEQTEHMFQNGTDTDTVTGTVTVTDNNNTSSKDDVSVSNETDADSAIDYNEIVELWNTTTKGTMGTLKGIDHNRRKMVRARIKEHGIETFKRMIDIASKSAYMHGQSWATFDWCIRPNNFPKVIEGNYLDKENNKIKDKYEKRRGTDVTAQSSKDYEGNF